MDLAILICWHLTLLIQLILILSVSLDKDILEFFHFFATQELHLLPFGLLPFFFAVFVVIVEFAEELFHFFF